MINYTFREPKLDFCFKYRNIINRKENKTQGNCTKLLYIMVTSKLWKKALEICFFFNLYVNYLEINSFYNNLLLPSWLKMFFYYCISFCIQINNPDEIFFIVLDLRFLNSL